MRAARFRVRTTTAAAALVALLCWLLATGGSPWIATVYAVVVGLLVDVAMYLYDIEEGRRHTPASQKLADALAAVRPDAEAAVTESARLAAEYLDRALTAEAALDRIRAYRSIAPADAKGPTWQALDIALLPPAEQPCLCTYGQPCPHCADDITKGATP
ncbi:hypothetical protein ABT081_10660 [Streptomyces sp. NPDC002238]|uniref:hypothetical protein n=1 Tax=Streptomyces sp. NPDC002238 TaxID=3156649 RepID=UPI0033257E64